MGENYNGLVRQYLPRGTSFIELTAERIEEIEEEINSRPGKFWTSNLSLN